MTVGAVSEGVETLPMRWMALAVAVLCGCETASPTRDGGMGAPVATAVWDDSWRTFSAKQTVAMGPTCAQRPSEWTVNLDTREVRYSGCFFNRTLSGTHVLSPSQFESLRTALRGLVTSNAPCLADADDFEVRVQTLSGEQFLEDASGACTSAGTRVDGFASVFQTLRSIVRQPLWDESITAFTASRHVVFGGPNCPGNSDSNWSVDLASGAFTWDTCTGSRASGSRTLAATEIAQIRTALEGVWLSTRTVCGADKPEQWIITATGLVWADDFYACRIDDLATVIFVEGIDGVFNVLGALSHEPMVEDAGVDAGAYPTGPAWPSGAQHVEVLSAASPLAPNYDCILGDGGHVSRSTWSLDLDSGVIDFAVCYPQENLYVVDSGVLQPAQLQAFNLAAASIEYVPLIPPPCSNDGSVDRFIVNSAAGPLTLIESNDICEANPDWFRVRNAQAARMILETATHP